MDGNLKEAFNYLVPRMITLFEKYLIRKKLDNRGRKRSLNLYCFFETLFEIVDSGSKVKYIANHHRIPKSTFFRYLKLLVDSKITRQLVNDQLKGYYYHKLLIIDSFLVKSLMGKEGTGRNPTDRGRRGVKNTLITDKHRVILHYKTSPANKSENNALRNILEEIKPSTQLLADAGFCGKEIAQNCAERKIHLIAKPRKVKIGQKNKTSKGYLCAKCVKGGPCKNGKTCQNSTNRKQPTPSGFKMTHELSKKEENLLEKHRWKIEATNAHIRNYRAVNLKMVKKITTYECLLEIAVLTHNYLALKQKY